MQSLSQFFDRLPLLPMQWDIHRNDELSGVGEGVVFQAELAPPLWTAEVMLRPLRLSQAQEVSALVRRLDGAREPFMFRDPFICGPRLDPAGLDLDEANVTIGAVNNGRISLSGLPAPFDYQSEANDLGEWPEGAAARVAVSLSTVPAGPYRLSVGDKLQVSVAGGKTYFLEVSEDVAASGAVTPLFSVFPRLPAAIAAGNAVTLFRPACPCVIVPKSFRPGSASGNIVRGIAFSIIQKRGV